MSTIVETIQEIIRHELRSVRVAELGLVDCVYPHSSGSDNDNYGCDVKLKNSGILLRSVPIATGHIGTVSVPNKGDLVLLAFDRGDVNQPIIIGRMYNDIDRPPFNNPDEIIFRLPLAEVDDKTVKAAIRNIKSNTLPREILVEMTPKITVRITDGTIRATAGSTEMKLEQPGGGDGKVTITAGNTSITMNQGGDVTIMAGGSMTLAAGGDLKLKGQNVIIKGDTDVQIVAEAQATLKGGAVASVEGAGSATLQGAMVSLKGMTSFSP